MWGIEKAAGFESQFKKFSRRHEIEAAARIEQSSDVCGCAS